MNEVGGITTKMACGKQRQDANRLGQSILISFCAVIVALSPSIIGILIVVVGFGEISGRVPMMAVFVVRNRGRGHMFRHLLDIVVFLIRGDLVEGPKQAGQHPPSWLWQPNRFVAGPTAP